MASVFESVEGLLALHRIVLAVRFTFAVEQRQGERGQQLFLQRAGLDLLVACSKGSLGKANLQMLDAIGTFGQEQEARLQSEVPALVDVMVLPDEVFRQGPILVALEGDSGFLLVQQRSARRDAASWLDAWRSATAALPIRLLGGTGDEAGALRCAWVTGLDVPYFSDLFHGQYEISRGCSAKLGRQVRHAKKALEKRVAAESKAKRVEVADSAAASRGGGEPGAKEPSPERKEAEEKVAQAEQRRRQMKEAILGLGVALHPFDLQTGEVRTAKQVEGEMTGHVTKAYEVAAEAKLGDKAIEALNKAEKLVPSMASQVTWWHRYCEGWVGLQGLETMQQKWVLTVLLPILYVTAVAGRADGAEKRNELRARAGQWMMTLMTGESVWRELSRVQQVMLLQGLKRCVGLWQRSSSATEGHNGKVSRLNGALHSLPPRWLKALQVMHNDATLRPDGTTAMERLFGVKPPNLFEWLVDHLPLPPRPACPRKRAPAANPLLLN